MSYLEDRGTPHNCHPSCLQTATSALHNSIAKAGNLPTPHTSSAPWSTLRHHANVLPLRPHPSYLVLPSRRCSGHANHPASGSLAAKSDITHSVSPLSSPAGSSPVWRGHPATETPMYPDFSSFRSPSTPPPSSVEQFRQQSSLPKTPQKTRSFAATLSSENLYPPTNDRKEFTSPLWPYFHDQSSSSSSKPSPFSLKPHPTYFLLSKREARPPVLAGTSTRPPAPFSGLLPLHPSYLPLAKARAAHRRHQETSTPFSPPKTSTQTARAEVTFSKSAASDCIAHGQKGLQMIKGKWSTRENKPASVFAEVRLRQPDSTDVMPSSLFQVMRGQRQNHRSHNPGSSSFIAGSAQQSLKTNFFCSREKENVWQQTSHVNPVDSGQRKAASNEAKGNAAEHIARPPEHSEPAEVKVQLDPSKMEQSQTFFAPALSTTPQVVRLSWPPSQQMLSQSAKSLTGSVAGTGRKTKVLFPEEHCSSKKFRSELLSQENEKCSIKNTMYYLQPGEIIKKSSVCKDLGSNMHSEPASTRATPYSSEIEGFSATQLAKGVSTQRFENCSSSFGDWKSEATSAAGQHKDFTMDVMAIDLLRPWVPLPFPKGFSTICELGHNERDPSLQQTPQRVKPTSHYACERDKQPCPRHPQNILRILKRPSYVYVRRLEDAIWVLHSLRKDPNGDDDSAKKDNANEVGDDRERKVNLQTDEHRNEDIGSFSKDRSN